MSIFGLQTPRIIGTYDLQLDYCEILKDEPEWFVTEYQDPISGEKIFVTKGYHWIYEVKFYLFKHADPDGTLDKLFEMLYEEITLYKHWDNEQFQDEDDTTVPFKFTELIPIYVERAIYRDALILKFESTEFVDYSKCTGVIPV